MDMTNRNWRWLTDEWLERKREVASLRARVVALEAMKDRAELLASAVEDGAGHDRLWELMQDYRALAGYPVMDEGEDDAPLARDLP